MFRWSCGAMMADFFWRRTSRAATRIGERSDRARGRPQSFKAPTPTFLRPGIRRRRSMERLFRPGPTLSFTRMA